MTPEEKVREAEYVAILVSGSLGAITDCVTGVALQFTPRGSASTQDELVLQVWVKGLELEWRKDVDELFSGFVEQLDSLGCPIWSLTREVFSGSPEEAAEEERGTVTFWRKEDGEMQAAGPVEAHSGSLRDARRVRENQYVIVATRSMQRLISRHITAVVLTLTAYRDNPNEDELELLVYINGAASLVADDVSMVLRRMRSHFGQGGPQVTARILTAMPPYSFNMPALGRMVLYWTDPDEESSEFFIDHDD